MVLRRRRPTGSMRKQCLHLHPRSIGISVCSQQQPCCALGSPPYHWYLGRSDGRCRRTSKCAYSYTAPAALFRTFVDQQVRIPRSLLRGELIPTNSSLLPGASTALKRCWFSRLACLLAGWCFWLAGWLAGWLPGCLAAWLPGCLAAWRLSNKQVSKSD